MTHKERQAYLQRLMASMRGEGTPLSITESGEVLEGEALPPFEEVAYELDLFPWMLDDAAGVVIQTVRRIPREVRQFVYGECWFVQGWFRVLRPTSKTYTIIVPETFDRDTGDDSILAHHIAMAWLQYQEQMAAGTWTLGDDVRAAELTRSWGFTGEGANVEQRRLEAERYGSTTPIL
jgi:hypothetical protein